MSAKSLIPVAPLGGKMKPKVEFMTPMEIKIPLAKPLHTDLIYDNREDRMNTHSLFSFLPTYDIADQNAPCLGVTNLAGIVNKRTKERNPVPDQFGIYPQPLPGTRSKVFGLAHTKCDIENSDNKVLRTYNNFNVHRPPPFKERL